MTTDTSGILNSFFPIGLNEMDNVRLMNRIDTKYVMPANRIPELLKKMDGAYRVLEINGERVFSYNSIYLDTFDFAFFSQHIRGIAGRCKVRYRTYMNTGNTFLEIKKKTSGNRTIKWRIENHLTPDNKYDGEALEFMSRYIRVEGLSLHPVISSEFRRITFVGREMTERMTLDFDIAFRDMESGSFNLPGIAILELKKDSFSKRSRAAGILKELCVHPTGFSKYCIGISTLCDVPKKNMIKPKLLLINKIQNEFYSRISACQNKYCKY